MNPASTDICFQADAETECGHANVDRGCHWPFGLLLVRHSSLTKAQWYAPHVHLQLAAAVDPPTSHPHSSCTGRRALPESAFPKPQKEDPAKETPDT